MFQDDFKSFIFDRINETISTLRKYNIAYQKENNTYNEIYDRLNKTLNNKQQKYLDDLLDSLNAIASEEQQAIYKIAIKDTLKLSNEFDTLQTKKDEAN